jgi:predicted transcriptional regulator of viral defense system
MRFFEFEKKMLKYPVFSSKEAKNIFFDEPNVLVQIAFWVKKGYIKKIEKGLYVLANALNDINPMTLAMKIYPPSYLSLEFALNYHGIIPDIPGIYTSVTTRKTMRYRNAFGNFAYRKIKKELFTGYKTVTQNNISYNMALPEKAIFDYLYLNKKNLKPAQSFWAESRIDEEFRFDKKKINLYKKIFKDKKINQLIDSLLDYQKNAR